MPNENDTIPKKSFKKVDALVTGMLLGGIVASIYGIKKTVDKQSAKKMEERIEDVRETEEKKGVFQKIRNLIFKSKKEEEYVTGEKKGSLKRILSLLFFGVKKEETEKKRSIFSIFKK